MNTHVTLPDEKPADHIETVRAFNRFYTNQLGLLGRAFLDSRFTLTEARIIYELAAQPGLSAKRLIEELHLDAAYLSRILKKFRNDGLLLTRPDPQDQRSQLLELTAEGLSEARVLAVRSRQEIAAMLSALNAAQQETIATAMGRIETLLSGSPARDFILRPHRPGDISWVLGRQTKLYIEEYGWNGEYEGLAMEIAVDFIQNFKAGREFCWIAEFRWRDRRFGVSGRCRRRHGQAAAALCRALRPRARYRPGASSPMRRFCPRGRLRNADAVDQRCSRQRPKDLRGGGFFPCPRGKASQFRKGPERPDLAAQPVISEH